MSEMSDNGDFIRTVLSCDDLVAKIASVEAEIERLEIVISHAEAVKASRQYSLGLLKKSLVNAEVIIPHPCFTPVFSVSERKVI